MGRYLELIRATELREALDTMMCPREFTERPQLLPCGTFDFVANSSDWASLVKRARETYDAL